MFSLYLQSLTNMLSKYSTIQCFKDVARNSVTEDTYNANKQLSIFIVTKNATRS